MCTSGSLKSSDWLPDGTPLQSTIGTEKKNDDPPPLDAESPPPLKHSASVGDITVPVRVFEQLAETLHLEKAALLLLVDPPRLFSPIASIGLDVTTQRRLRIPSEILQQNKRLVRGEPIRISSEGLTFLESFFSTRLFDLLDSLHMIPLRFQDTLYGVLLICDETGMPHFEPSIRALREITASEAEVYRSYTGRLSQLPAPMADRSGSDPLELLEYEIHAADRNQAFLLCILIDVKPIIDEAYHFTVTVDRFRFRDDLLRILHSLVHLTGGVVAVGRDRFIIVMRTRTSTDPGFILGHVALTLRDFYPSLKSFSRAVTASTYYPENATTPQSILDRLGITTEDG